MKKLHLKEKSQEGKQEPKETSALTFDEVLDTINADAFKLETDRTRNPFGYQSATKNEPSESSTLSTNGASSNEKDSPNSSLGKSLKYSIVTCVLLAVVGVLYFWQRESEFFTRLTAFTSNEADTSTGIISNYVKENLAVFDTKDSIHGFIENLKVNGVFLDGENSAIILNGTTYRAGETVSNEFGLTFVGFRENPARALFKGRDQQTYFKSMP